MQHDFFIEGIAFRLRPVTDADAAFILSLRTDSSKSKYIHKVSGQITDQLEWLKKYYKREGDYYFIIENKKNFNSEGVISLYDIERSTLSGEWGRWIISPGSLSAVESAWLIYKLAFDVLNLKEVYCRTVADNSSVVSFHDSCGIENKKKLPNFFELNNHRVDAVEHRVCLDDWKHIEPNLYKLVSLTARRISRA